MPVGLTPPLLIIREFSIARTNWGIDPLVGAKTIPAMPPVPVVEAVITLPEIVPETLVKLMPRILPVLVDEAVIGRQRDGGRGAVERDRRTAGPAGSAERSVPRRRGHIESIKSDRGNRRGIFDSQPSHFGIVRAHYCPCTRASIDGTGDLCKF